MILKRGNISNFADIASDKQHIEELRHAIHVKEVIEGND